MKISCLIICIFLFTNSYAQLTSQDSVAKAGFLNEQQQLSRSFNVYFNSNTSKLYSADEKAFIGKIDSLRRTSIVSETR